MPLASRAAIAAFAVRASFGRLAVAACKINGEVWLVTLMPLERVVALDSHKILIYRSLAVSWPQEAHP